MKDEQGSVTSGGVTECDRGPPNTHTTFGFLLLGAGGVQMTHGQSALVLRAQMRCCGSAGLSSPCGCFWGGVKMLAMSVLKGSVQPYYIKKHIFSLVVSSRQIVLDIYPGYLTPGYFHCWAVATSLTSFSECGVVSCHWLAALFLDSGNERGTIDECNSISLATVNPRQYCTIYKKMVCLWVQLFHRKQGWHTHFLYFALLKRHCTNIRIKVIAWFIPVLLGLCCCIGCVGLL